MSHGAYAYRIHICNSPGSLDTQKPCAERAWQIVDKLAQTSVHVTEWKPTHVRCETSLHIDKLLTLLHSLDVKPEDITLEN